MVRKIGWLLWAALAVVAIAAWLNHVWPDLTAKRPAPPQAKADAQLVSPVIASAAQEDAWLAYVDRRIATALRREGAVIFVAVDLGQFTNRTTAVSRNTPYTVSCDTMNGGSIQFASNQGPAPIDELRVTVFGMMASVDPAAEKPPEVGVYPGISVLPETANQTARDSAAKHISPALNQTLCRRIVEKMQVLMAP